MSYDDDEDEDDDDDDDDEALSPKEEAIPKLRIALPSSPVTHMAPIVKTAPIKLAWKTTSACDAGFGTSKNRRSCDG